MKSAESKLRLLFINSDGVSDPFMELGQSPSPRVELFGISLSRIHHFEPHSEGHVPSVTALLLDLETVKDTKPLDAWAIKAWRESLNDLVLRCLKESERAPTLLAYTREPSWESASLALRLGAREITKLSLLPQFLKEIFSIDDKNGSTNNSANILSFVEHQMHKQNPDKIRAAPRVEIPKFAIPFPIDGLEGESPAIEEVKNVIRRSAPLDTSVLIQGPTGSGKELVARSIHRHSARSSGPFVAVNCGAISPELMETEFFGYSKGAFTGAQNDKKGLLESANGGTFFLDEVTELPLSFQVKLLRALQEKLIYPVGSSEALPLDIRLVAASKEDLDEKVKNKSFREDLLYRLKVIELTLPSLSERRSDIPQISKTVLKRLARKHRRETLQLSNEILEKFLIYHWKGNVRELENTLEHAVTLAWSENRKKLMVSDLPDAIQFATMSKDKSQHLKEVVRRFEREYIASTIRRLGGGKEQAADALGLSLATLYRKLGQ